MVNLIANIIGAASSILFVGFLAYKIDRLPLSVIVVATLCLMVYSFYDDMRKDRADARTRNG